VPFGYVRGEGGDLIPVPAEQEIISKIVAMRRDGAPLRRIQASVEREHGRKLSLDALSRIAHEAVLDQFNSPSSSSSASSTPKACRRACS
jgi:hypothetical protein